MTPPSDPQTHAETRRAAASAAGHAEADIPASPMRIWARRLGGLLLLLALGDLVIRRPVLTYGAAACVVAMAALLVVESLRTGMARTRWFDVRRDEQPLGFWLFLVAMLLGAIAAAAALVAIGTARRLASA